MSERAPSCLCAGYGVEAGGFLPATIACVCVCVRVCVFIKLHITAHSGPVILLYHSMQLALILLRGLCVCVFSSHSFWKSSSLDVPAEVTQEEGHTGFFIYLPSAVRALIFLARRIQPFFSLVDCEVKFLCANDLIVLHSLGIFFFFVCEKNPVYRDRTYVSTCQKVTRLPLSYRGDRHIRSPKSRGVQAVQQYSTYELQQ